MELLQVRDFGKSGLNTDLPAWDLPPSFLTYAFNYRVFNNKLFGFGGHKTHDEFPPGFESYHVTYNPASGYWIFAGTDIYAWDGTIFSSISGSLGPFTVQDGWTSCNMGRIPVLNDQYTYPMAWLPQRTDTDFTVLPFDINDTWEDKEWSCKAMRSFGPYLIAMNMTEGSVESPDTVRWSHPAERNEVPSNWDETDPTSLAGKNILGGEAGDIIDGLALRNSFVLYRDFGITVLDYSGDSYVFNAQDLTTTANIAGINSICEVKGVHFVICNNDIIQNTGDRIESILHLRLRVRYASVVNQDYIHNSFSVHNATTKEYWAFLPTGDAQYPNEAWVYNYREDSWSIHAVNNPTHADYGNLDSDARIWGENVLPENLHAIWDETWETATGVWAKKNNRVFNKTILGPEVTSEGNSTIQLLDGFTSEVDFTTTLERTDFPLTTMQDVNTITRVYPHVKSSQDIFIQVGSQQLAGGPVAWRPKVRFKPGVDRKIDVMTTGELFSFRIEAYSNSNFEFSGLDVEYTHSGLR